MAPLCHSLRFCYSLDFVCIDCLAVLALHARFADLFVRKVSGALYIRGVCHGRAILPLRETLRPQLCRRDFRALYTCVYICRICTSRREIPRRNDYPTRCIAFLSDRYRADSFRSIFYRYFEILEAVARSFRNSTPCWLNSHFEILMRPRQDTLLAHVIGADVVVFISLRIEFFADNRNSSTCNLLYFSFDICSLYHRNFIAIVQPPRLLC